VTTNAVTKYYALAGGRVAMRQGTAVYYLYGDHLPPAGVLRFAPRGRDSLHLRDNAHQPAVHTLRENHPPGAGQRMDGFGLMDYNARYYSNYLNRFLSADTLIPNAGKPADWDRYSYASNSPVIYSDPSGHCYNRDSNGNLTARCQAYWKTYTNVIQLQIYQPSESCLQKPECHDSYETFMAVVEQLGRVPTEMEMLRMTAGTEYFIYEGYAGVGEFGEEALARNYYSACGLNMCQGDELYHFMSGYSPWFGIPGTMDDGSPALRATHLITSGLNNGFGGAGYRLDEDVEEIMGDRAIRQRWTEGRRGDRPWQWYGPFTPPNKDPSGIYSLSVDLGNGQVFWMFTSDQDIYFNKVWKNSED